MVSDAMQFGLRDTEAQEFVGITQVKPPLSQKDKTRDARVSRGGPAIRR